jgi:hypothetical protein
MLAANEKVHGWGHLQDDISGQQPRAGGEVSVLEGRDR